MLLEVVVYFHRALLLLDSDLRVAGARQTTRLQRNLALFEGCLEFAVIVRRIEKIAINLYQRVRVHNDGCIVEEYERYAPIVECPQDVRDLNLQHKARLNPRWREPTPSA